MKFKFAICCWVLGAWCLVFGAAQHPRVYFKKKDLPALREKAREVKWAAAIVKGWHRAVDRHVENHKTNPSLIVSHLQMHWEEGKRHTRFYTDGNFIPRREGNAKYPTIRPPYARSWGDGIKSGDWENDPPYSDGSLTACDGSRIPFERTGQAYENLNDWFLRLAYWSSILYALEGDEAYAKFAADIVWVLVRGGAQQEQINPDEESGNCGFLSWETLGDTRHYWAIPLIWDILYDYFHETYFDTDEFKYGIRGGDIPVAGKGSAAGMPPPHSAPHQLWAPGHPEGKAWALEQFHIFFEKMIDNKLTRGGGLIGNWNLNEHQSAMLYALALDGDKAYADGKGRGHYVKQLVRGPTTERNGAYMDVLRANIDPKSGLWPEAPGGYGQGSIAQLVKFGFIYWKNGLDLLSRDPLLLKASRAMPQMVFPNGFITNIGDSSYHRIWTDQLELMAAYASTKGDTELLERCAALIRQVGNRDLKDDLAFFFYLPELPDMPAPPLSRVSYASCYPVVLERNPAKSGEAKDALAFSLAGFSTKMGHRHPNGLTLELYGRGEILAPDIGAGGDYWVRETHQYYRQPAAHNTCVPNGCGLDDRREMLLDIKAAEPMPQEGEDVFKTASPHRQFVDVESVFDAGDTKAKQRRTVAIVRSGAKTGYYIDIFRSKVTEGEEKYHDYLYHNVGEWTQGEAASRRLNQKSGETPLPPDSGKGYEYFKPLASLSNITNWHGAITYDGDITTGIHLATFPGDELYLLEGPKAFRHYNRKVDEKPCPALLLRRQGEAWKRPFVAVYEPYGGGVNEQIASVTAADVKGAKGVLAVTVTYKSDPNRRDVILSADTENAAFTYAGIKFKSSFAVVTFSGNRIANVYPASGTSSRPR